MPEDVPLGTLLRRHRRAAGMTLEAAETSGVSARAISDMERGRTRAPQRRTLRSLVDALGVTPPDRDAVFTAAAVARERRAPWCPGSASCPRGAADFTAWASEMAALEKIAVGSVVLISGPPGTGKTTLAIRAPEVLGDAIPQLLPLGLQLPTPHIRNPAHSPNNNQRPAGLHPRPPFAGPRPAPSRATLRRLSARPPLWPPQATPRSAGRLPGRRVTPSPPLARAPLPAPVPLFGSRT
jgi:transcriptional regulator with XRE-family HTH domain